jgi:hypothetical protein
VEPCGKSTPGADATCTAYQGEEHSLESVLGVGLMSEELTTHSPDKRPVPAHEFLECLGISCRREACEEICIRSAGISHANNSVQQQRAHRI